MNWHNEPFIEKIPKLIEMCGFKKKEQKEKKKPLPTSRKQVELNNLRPKKRLILLHVFTLQLKAETLETEPPTQRRTKRRIFTLDAAFTHARESKRKQERARESKREHRSTTEKR